MSPVLLVLSALLVGARAGVQREPASSETVPGGRSTRALGVGLPHGCLYEGRWHTEGSAVTTREACLSCVCARGALSCRRRACAPLPDPPPTRCHVLHRRGACCPELHCPSGVTLTERAASARLETEAPAAIVTPGAAAHACVDGGAVFAAGSAMASGVPCEHCFCLGGVRRCVRPRCLPPPAGCRARPAPGACCPQRYYCQHPSTEPPDQHHYHDCEVDGQWVQEGDRVPRHSNGSCTTCFCLRAAVHCQPSACAPPLLGCQPLLRPGECCAHQYQCNHDRHVTYIPHFLPPSNNALIPPKNNDRSFHSLQSSSFESTTKNILIGIDTLKNTPISSATKNHLVTATKVKRKTEGPPPGSPIQTIENATEMTTTESSKSSVANLMMEETTTEFIGKETTNQPDGTMKIVINGTINCTAELSSTSLPLNFSHNDTERIKMESLPKTPINNAGIEVQTYSPNDIITDRNVDGGFDENETFTINVTSSLMPNKNHSTIKPAATPSKISVKVNMVDALNTSKKTKGDYDYDYTEPTLPPSLPNLKIIPFVAADAVVEDDTVKDTYPMLEREDKYPVYYPNVEKDTIYATRREDVYHPTQYPVFISDKEPQYPALTHDVDLTSKYHSAIESLLKYTVSSSFGEHVSDAKVATKVPTTSATFGLDTPAVNLFSPPIETEGGFIPKDPGILDEYYAVYPSTPPVPAVPAVPHLTTSMQLDMAKGECVSTDGEHIPEGDSILIGCSECRCVWAELRCLPKFCHTPPHCSRVPAGRSATDVCCGELVCEGNGTTTTIKPTKYDISEIKTNSTNQAETTIILPTTSKSGNEIISTTETVTHVNVTTDTNVLDNIAYTTNLTTIQNITTRTDQITNETNFQEYDDDDDEGFSFGSVLKLLLSDTYETTTSAAHKKATSTKLPTKSTSTITLPTKRLSTIGPFIPLPPIPSSLPKKSSSTISRIDHLVLGEVTAVKKTTPRPLTFKTTNKPQETTRPVVTEAQLVTHEGPRPPNLSSSGVSSSLLKLAGCNIYGRMYRVGRIIAELSTPCQECWCTEVGVQCKQLGC